MLLKRFIISPLLFLVKLPFLLILGALLFGGDAFASMVRQTPFGVPFDRSCTNGLL